VEFTKSTEEALMEVLPKTRLAVVLGVKLMPSISMVTGPPFPGAA